MYTILQTESFVKWLAGLRDVRAKVRIVARLRQAEFGNIGDVKSLGSGISELRVDTGPGYRLYFTRRREVLIILLAGGDKSTQKTDIKRARKLAEELEV
jgi:putative addiction module killer protein